MYTLYYAPGAASLAVHLALIESGAPHRLKLVDTATRQQKSPEYLKLNPNGLVPTLIVDGQPVYECAALLLLLAERHPECGFAPAPGRADTSPPLHPFTRGAHPFTPPCRMMVIATGPAPVRGTGASGRPSALPIKEQP